ncbi:MAG: LysR family transcriptional regulator [Oscillospiraceae bacterium]
MYNPQLETFLCVVESGSFNKAAEKLFISPPAVIKQINLLEGSLGLTLFERTHRGLILTKAGQSLYQDAKYIIQYCKDSVTRAKNAMQESGMVIRIGTSPMTPARSWWIYGPKYRNIALISNFSLFLLKIHQRTPERFWQTWARTSMWWLGSLMKRC